MSSEWLLPGATRDGQSVNADWEHAGPVIHGVRIKLVHNVVRDSRTVTELYRREWGIDDLPIDQVFQAVLAPHALSAWHAHELTHDRLFISQGKAKIVLFDSRQGSPTHGLVNELHAGEQRPTLVMVPPKVWHGVENLAAERTVVTNLVDRAYRYDAPDHWRLPPDTNAIPYRFRPR